MKRFLRSLHNAYRGINHAFLTERNIRIHLLMFVLVLIAAYILDISKIEWLLILVISAMNFSMELSNTAIERLADKVSPEYDFKIGMVKDVMAGAVLVSSIFSVIIGIIIFYDPLFKFIQR